MPARTLKSLCDAYEAPKIMRCAPDQLCEPCQTLAELDAQISDAKILEMKALIEELEQRRNVTKTQMNQVHDPLIQQVPSEIASSIFTLIVEEGFRRNYGLPFILASVCKKWHEIIFSTPQVWAGLALSHASRKHFPVSLVERWLNRSGQLPLNILLFFVEPGPDAEDVKSLTEVICAHSHRWNSLEFIIGYRAAFPVFKADIQVNSSLKNLKIAMYGNWNQTFTPENIILRPQKVSLAGIPPAHVHIDWINVVDFKADNIAWTEILYFLQRWRPEITIKEMRLKSLRQESIQVPPVPLIFPRLEFLESLSDNDGLLDFITAPLLRTLKLTRNRDLVQVASMLKRSGSPSLEELELGLDLDWAINEEDFTGWLKDLSSLKSLSLYSGLYISSLSNDGAFIRQFLTGSSPSFKTSTSECIRSPLLPCLEKFEITTSIGLSWDTIVAIYQIYAELPLTARSDLNLQQSRYLNSMRPLRSLSVRIGHGHHWIQGYIPLNQLIDKDSLLRLFDLPKNSFRMTLDAKGTQLMEASIKHHHLTPDKDVLSFLGLGFNV